jgi:hypothetical protein
MALAWAPMGVVAAVALRAAGLHGRGLRALVVAAVAYVVLIAVGAVSDAVLVSGSVGAHLSPQFGRAGTLVATAIMAIGALVVRERQEPREAPTAP